MASQYRFSSLVYQLTSFVENDYAENAFEWLDWDESLNEDLTKFSRTSILQRVALLLLEEELQREMRKDPEAWLETGKLEGLEEDLKFYKIKVQRFSSYIKSKRIGFDDHYDSLYLWSCENQAAFDELFFRYSKEIEHLLFGNRHFLVRFHTHLASFLSSQHENSAVISTPIPRSYLPEWVKTAVYFRDRGRCVFCNSDLTGTINTELDKNYDHIVSLASGGVNDVTNIQLTCEPCNYKKATRSDSNYRYLEWWPDEALI